MHRGNVLVRRTHQEFIYFRLDGVEYSIKSHGVMATIVDYTLSRVKQGLLVAYLGLCLRGGGIQDFGGKRGGEKN